jgi:AraC-like DNA-binding protein
MHLVFRWSDHPLFVCYDARHESALALGESLVGGAREQSYVRKITGPSSSVGALLLPGTASLLFGVPASETAERHTALEDLWSAAEVAELRERFEASPTCEARVQILEASLLSRLPRVRALHPAVAEALARLARAEPIANVVEHCGYSHRTLATLFHRAVGLTPKVFLRVTRLQRAIAQMNNVARPRLASVAQDAGYADQAHFTREFTRITGVNPSYYLRVAPKRSNHVPLVASVEPLTRAARRAGS